MIPCTDAKLTYALSHNLICGVAACREGTGADMAIHPGYGRGCWDLRMLIEVHDACRGPSTGREHASVAVTGSSRCRQWGRIWRNIPDRVTGLGADSIQSGKPSRPTATCACCFHAGDAWEQPD